MKSDDFGKQFSLRIIKKLNKLPCGKITGYLKNLTLNILRHSPYQVRGMLCESRNPFFVSGFPPPKADS
jgi:hypothetical protein